MPKTVTWKQFSRKGWSAFASLHLQISIGVLSTATLLSVTPIKAQNTQEAAQSTESEEHKLEEVQVTGTMAPLTQLQTARIVAVLTREDIQQAGAESVNDILKLASGVDVRQRGGFGIQTDISLDGGTFDQITLLLNGIDITNPQTGHLTADLPVSPNDIERIEILSGASSRVYGGSAFGGCINIVTRLDTKSTISTGLEAGMFGSVQGDARFSLDNLHNRLSNSLSATGGRSRGGTDNSDWRKAQLYYQGDFQYDRLTLDWQFGFSKKNYGANTFYSAAYPDQYERNERYLISISATTKGRFQFRPSVWWQRTYDNFQLVRNTNFGENHHQTDVYGLRLVGHIKWHLGTTAVGTEMRNEGILSTNLGVPIEVKKLTPSLPHFITSPLHHFLTPSLHHTYDHHLNRTAISYNIEHNILLPHFTLSAGLIATLSLHHSITSSLHHFQLFPGVDMAYRPTTNWKLYASYSKGYRLPTFTDLYYHSPTLQGNTELQPEQNHSMQLGTQYQTNALQATLRAFYHRGHNMIDWVMYTPEDIYHSTSFELDNIGLQGEAKIQFERLFKKDILLRSFTIGYTFIHQHRRDQQEIFRSNYALEYLHHKFTATLHHSLLPTKITSRLSATWHFRWQSRMGGYILYEGQYTDPTTGYQRVTSTGQFVPYKPYATLDIKLQWTASHYRLYLQCSNLTNRRYYDFGNVPQPGAWLMAGVRVDF